MAASTVDFGIASMPERKISMLKAPANSDSEMIAHCTLEIIGIEGARAVGHARQQVAEPEVEEVDLHQRRRIAEERR